YDAVGAPVDGAWASFADDCQVVLACFAGASADDLARAPDHPYACGMGCCGSAVGDLSRGARVRGSAAFATASVVEAISGDADCGGAMLARERSVGATFGTDVGAMGSRAAACAGGRSGTVSLLVAAGAGAASETVSIPGSRSSRRKSRCI